MNSPEDKLPPRTPRWIKDLLAWFDTNRRAMPWRDDPVPYAVWISEMMLQQTQVDTVRPYFDRFIKRFPDIHTLASAPLDDVLKHWEGLGYYARARNLHRAAQIMVERYDGHVPGHYHDLLELPGVGPYAAAAIASIAFGEAKPSVDGNVLRVVSRFRGRQVDIKQKDVVSEVRGYLQSRIPLSRPGDFNQALMELGALVCKPRGALCTACPLRPSCKAAQRDIVDEIPLKTPKVKVPHHDMLAVIVRKRGRILLVKRDEKQMLGGLWEFPGGRRKAGESLSAAAARTCRESAGIEVRPGVKRGVVKHAYSHFRITLHVFESSNVSGQVRAGEIHSIAEWVSPAALREKAMPITARKVVESWLEPQ